MPEIEFALDNWRLIWSVGGILIFTGSMIMLMRVNSRNISELWQQKADKEVVERIETAVSEIRTMLFNYIKNGNHKR